MANRYWVGTGNWNDTAHWSLTSGGAGGASIPNSTADKAIFDANSGNAIVNTTGYGVYDLDISACPNGVQIILNYNLSVVRNFTGNANAIPTMYASGLGTLFMGGSSASAWVMNGCIFDCIFRQTGAGVKTLTGDLIFNKLYNIATSATVNGGRMIANAGAEGASTASYNLLGTTELIVKGGNYFQIVKRGAGGKLTFDGDVNIKGSTTSSVTGIYDTTFTYVSGNITVDPNIVFSMGGSNTVNVGSNIIFENLDVSGTLTLLSDLYATKSVGCIGTITTTFVGAYNVHFGYGGGVGNLIMYNLGTFISTTTKLIMEGTGKVFSGISFGGLSYPPVNPLQCDLEINTAGTVTFDTGSVNQWGNNRTLTYTAGTVVTTGCTWTVSTGGYTFNTNNAFTIPTLNNTTTLNIPSGLTATTANLLTGSTTNAYGTLTTSTLKMNGTAVLNKPNDSTSVDVSTNLYLNGTDSEGPSLNSIITVNDFVTNLATNINPTTNRMNFASFPALSTFTFAFDFIYVGYTGESLNSTGGYLYIPNTATTRMFWFISSNAFYFYHGLTLNQRARIVFSKTNGQPAKAWVNGVAKSIGYQGTYATLLAGTSTFSQLSKEVRGEALLLDTGVDQSWVDVDQAKYLAGEKYVGDEPNLIAGWHKDDYTPSVTGMKLNYNGTLANQKVFGTTFRHVNASGSAVPIYDWYGSERFSSNIYPVTGDNIGGQPQAFVKINGVKKKINLAVTKV